MSERAYRRMFVGAAVWNVAGSAFLFIFTSWIFGRDGLPPPDPPVFYHTWLAMCVVFGAGYFGVARNPYGHLGIVAMGIAGKLAFAAIFLFHLVGGARAVPTFFLVPVIGDLWFVVRFAMFLRFARKSAVDDRARRREPQ